MKKPFRILIFVLLFIGYQNLHAQVVILVDASKTNTAAVRLSAVTSADWANACGDLQSAIDAALSGDLIWVKAGTYVPVFNQSFRLKAGIKVYGNFSGTETLFAQRNSSDKTSETVLKGNGRSVVYAGSVSDCVLSGFTITGGVGNPYGPSGTAGGGIYIFSSTITIFGCIIRDNIAGENGGGIFVHYKSDATITRCIIQNNTASSAYGGGIHVSVQSFALVWHCELINNTASEGGGICAEAASHTELISSSFTGNNSINNGGGYSALASGTTMDNCNFIGNTAGGMGGGIAIMGGSSATTINNCVLSANSADLNSGGIFSESNYNIILNGCIIHNNISNSGAGGGSGPFKLTNCLILNNKIRQGDVAGISTSNGGFFKNSIIWGNTSADNSGGSKLQVSSGSTVSHSIFQNGYAGLANSSADPLFADITNPAGIDGLFGTQDDGLRLQSCSPAIDAGINDGVELIRDITISERFYNDIIDIGPYEYQGSRVAEALLALNNESGTKTVGATEKAVILVDGSACKALAEVGSAGSQPVTGSITTKVWIDVVQPSQFVKRHYEITPADNATLATGRVTLYATDAELNAYNTQSPAPSRLLPLSTDDEATKALRIANINIEKRSGISSDGTGRPATYSGSITTIDPVDTDIVWNSTAERWEISFNVTGFSGFFIKTIPVPLPVNWVSVGASLNMENQPVISWKVQETTVASYTIQKSDDAIKFETIGKLEGQGDGLHEYRFTDIDLRTGKIYYRIRQTDLDGSTTWSRIVTVDDKSNLNVSIAYPIPAKNEVFIHVKNQGELPYEVILADLSGKILKTQTLSTGSNKVDISKLQVGIYLLRTTRGEVFKIVKD